MTKTMANNIKNEFAALKKAIIERSALRLDEALLKAVSDNLDRFGASLDASLSSEDERCKQLKEENNILRSISGLPENEMRAKSVEQNEEIRFLREQLLKLKKSFDALKAEEEEARVKIEQLKAELSKDISLRASGQKKAIDDLEGLNKELSALKAKIAEQETEINREKQRLLRENEEFTAGLRIGNEERIINEIKLVGGRLRNLSGPLAGSAKFCLEKLENIKKNSSGVANRFFVQKIAGKVIKSPQEYLVELGPDLDMIQNNSQEIARVLDTYLELYEDVKVNIERIDFKGLWNELNMRFINHFKRIGASIKWPSIEKYPDFRSDRKLVSEICNALLLNAMETVGKGGTVEVLGAFGEEKCDIFFTDDGAGIKENDRDKVFLPFFTTKPGRAGMGLPNARKFARSLGGDIKYEPRPKGSVFILTVPGRK